MRLIDLEEVYEKYGHMNTLNTGVLLLGLSKLLDDAPEVEAIPKDQYEARLKAELKEIREEIRKNKLFPTVFINPHESARNAYREAVNNDLAILDKKISELEGE